MTESTEEVETVPGWLSEMAKSLNLPSDDMVRLRAECEISKSHLQSLVEALNVTSMAAEWPKWLRDLVRRAGHLRLDLLETKTSIEVEIGKLTAIAKAADTILGKRESTAYIRESTEAGLRQIVDEVIDGKIQANRR